MAKGNKGSAATNADPQREERPQAEAEAPPVDIGAGVETTATEAPIDDPGPEDFERHSGARLVDDHARDLATLADLERRIKARGHAIATKLRAKGANATISIGGRDYVSRARPERSGGGMMLAELGKRVEASLD